MGTPILHIRLAEEQCCFDQRVLNLVLICSHEMTAYQRSDGTRTGAEDEPPSSSVGEMLREVVSLCTRSESKHVFTCQKTCRWVGSYICPCPEHLALTVCTGSAQGRALSGLQGSGHRPRGRAARTGSFAFSRVRMAWNIARAGTLPSCAPRLRVSTASRTASSAAETMPIRVVSVGVR